MNERKSITDDFPGRYGKPRGKGLPKKRLEVLHPHAAGIDVGSRHHYVSVAEDCDQDPVRRFGCYTPELEAMASWLKDCGITTVVMEATGVFWIPVFYVLEERGLEVLLVNPRHVQYVPGRKSDVADCQWLRQLHTYGLLRGAFVPASDVAAVRAYWRQRRNLVESASREIQHMQKALPQMNIQLSTTLSDITGVSGMKILRAIVAGQRDPQALAQLANTKVKCSREEIVQSLTGHYTDEQLFLLQQALELYDIFHVKIQECDQRLAQYLELFPSKAEPSALAPHPKRPKRARRKNQPYFDLRSEVYRLAGVDLTRIDGIDAMTAFTVLSEIGFDVTAFPTEGEFVSWLALCPNHRITGGKVKRRSTKQVVNRAANALRTAAQSLWHSTTYLGACYRRYNGRLGPAKTITAMAHKLARLIYHMLKHGEEYVDKGQEHLEKQHRERSIKSLIHRAKEFGLTLVDTQTGECLA